MAGDTAAALTEPGILDGLCGKIRLCAVPTEELLEIDYRLTLIKEGKIKYLGGKPEFLSRGLFDGVDMETSFSAIACTLNNIGPGFSKVGPFENFAFFSSASKVLLSFNMLIGRLEIFPMLFLFAPSTWRKK